MVEEEEEDYDQRPVDTGLGLWDDAIESHAQKKEEPIFQNIIKLSPSLLKKRVRRRLEVGKDKNKVAIAVKEKEKLDKKVAQEYFNGVDLKKKLKERREKTIAANRKKAKAMRGNRAKGENPQGPVKLKKVRIVDEFL
eukprot:TRINITY_DN4922_c0_g1_i4.p1 TRINITY_DN4922_c0_g1~~TRINITY_DN4922_c0_g1_i4.p1  ORF type:complete len:138 (+),score=45.25 TRINITY_DN4922_c0_g1_i4:805-1218(+)